MGLNHISRNTLSWIAVVLLGTGGLVPTASVAGMRVWENASGSQQVIAEFSELRDGYVYLKKVGGTILKAPLEELSAGDSDYLAGVEELSDQFNIPADGRLLAYTREARANAAYSMKRSLARRVKADYRIETTVPGFVAEEWVVYAAQPPEFDGQTVRSRLLPDADTTWEARNGERLLWRSRIPATNSGLKKRFIARLEIEADLYTRSLVDAEESENVVEPLPEGHAEIFTSPTSLLNYRSSEISDWIEEAGLNRKREEGQVDFARRVYQAIQADFEYSYTEEMDRRASSVCHFRTSDCGGLSNLFVSVLRRNGIPARLLAGRWAKSAKPGDRLEGLLYDQQHVKSEFFAAGVGWVPVDMSLGVNGAAAKETAAEGDREEGGDEAEKSYFGNDEGDFITLHFDNDFAVETIYFGVEKVEWLQGIHYWASGSGNLDSAETEKSWTVTELTP